MRTLKDLATEALQIQDASNLSGLVHGWSRAVTELREIMPTADTKAINRHPINKLWAAKLSDLAGVSGDGDGKQYHDALMWANEHSR